MKKLLVLLTACATICAFVSCGEKEKSSSSETLTNESSVSENTTEESSVVEPETRKYDESVDKTAFVGKWECSKFIKGGEEYTNVNGIPQYALFQYDFQEDGKVNLADSLMEIADPESNVSYSWGAVSDDEVEVYSNDGSVSAFKLIDGQLVNSVEDEEFYLDKVDEFQEFDFKAYYEQLSGGYSLVPITTDEAGNVVGEGEPIPIE